FIAVNSPPIMALVRTRGVPDDAQSVSVHRAVARPLAGHRLRRRLLGGDHPARTPHPLAYSAAAHGNGGGTPAHGRAHGDGVPLLPSRDLGRRLPVRVLPSEPAHTLGPAGLAFHALVAPAHVVSLDALELGHHRGGDFHRAQH